jgi:hypothetical protein
MVVSFSFLELGQAAISNGIGWTTCAILRSHVISEVQGGWAHCLRKFLERMLVGQFGLCTAGFPITIDGTHVMMFGKLTNILSDGDGLRMALDWRGASGMKPCFKHFNVYKKDRSASKRAQLTALATSVALTARAG